MLSENLTEKRTDPLTGEKEENPITGDTGPGTGLQDLLPLPAEDAQDILQSKKAFDKSAGGLEDGHTLSHALATEDHKLKGAAQLKTEKEVSNLGWNEPKREIAAPLVGGIDNEELWMLVRRFNKASKTHLSFFTPVPGGLDLNTAEEEEFSPDKMRANIERLYTTVVVGILAAVKHIARLRSWREKERTAWFAGVYFVAWLFDFIMPLITGVIIALIVHPPTRELLFPPAPIALVDSKTGGVQKPWAGTVGSKDSATGAPENHKGEAVEQEADNLVHGLAELAVSSAAGKHPAGDVQDKTKKPMELAMWAKLRPVMQVVGNISDNWERLANALSPTPPFPKDTHRLRLAILVIPLFGASLFVTSYMFVKSLTFFLGFGMFGDPVIRPGMEYLNRVIPDWQKLLELRNTLLKGVPTNAQLTLTLLRIGEANKAPLPPVPRVIEQPVQDPANGPAPLDSEAQMRAEAAAQPLEASPSELDEAAHTDPKDDLRDAGFDVDSHPKNKQTKKSHKVLGWIKNVTAGVVHTGGATDHVRAKLGVHHAKDRLGVVPPKDEIPVSGPVRFDCRHEGKKGHCYISTAATIPSVAFVAKKDESSTTVIAGKEREDLKPMWTVAVADIMELKKVGGYGWKAKIVVDWSMEREVKDGLKIVTMEGKRFRVTACPLRDELFNRLVAMGGQRWEAW
ncbi:hypothetical protein NEUTE1DRAFT_46952 [Neurospora tetrasperma FGSC 2508]|uniref:Uncharacterized protein n=1 Tax=Neurospora tetrasperma (strain FGSC 2508 / ATCC MYA-4615 / P0657) TaxID=510951 RepID=F8MUG1_NEUT8|nr:uncharacterized protein NEUTE1DRAFT_46952 [Neurospora tetrasperma FGSC 2508]EGO55643.1 hypothetical protein NEUTE1DRAFT_46952 [Neurospora tetrasperma FGSC 2508]